MFVGRLLENKVYCYLATKAEVEGFRDQDFVLQIYMKWKAFKFRVLWLLKKALPSREEPVISQVHQS